MKKRTVGIILAVSVVLLGIGASILGIFPLVLKKKVGQMMSVSREIDALKRWLNPPVPIYMKCYFFNLSNPDEFKNGNKAKFTQIGPYVYREERLKTITGWTDDDDVVEYNEAKKFTFVANMSTGSDTDTLRTVNLPLVSIAAVPDSTPFKAQIINSIKAKELTEKLSVDELLFRRNAILTNKMIETMLNKLGASFSILKDTEEPFRMYTGKSDPTKINVIKEAEVATKTASLDTVKYLNPEMIVWDDEYCNMINGTDGSQIPPSIDKDKKLYIFVKDFCRSIYMTFEKETTVRGIEGYRYTIPGNFYESPLREPSNKCFCPSNDTDCEKKGLLRQDKCKNGAPIYISAPHFYNADESFVQAVEGLSPNKQEHEAFLITEPLTGTILNVSRRIQINIRIIHRDDVVQFENMTDLIFPILWLDEHAEIDEGSATLFKGKVYKPQQTVKAVSITLIVVGALLVCCSVVALCKRKRDDRDLKMTSRY